MPRRLAPLLLVPGLLMTACAGQQASAPPAPTALRFAQNLEGADQAVEGAVGRMDAFERLAAREDAAIAYASGGRDTRARFNALPAGAAEAAGRVLAPAFTALGDYGHILAQVASGQPIVAKPSPTGAELARDAAAGLDAVRAATGTAVPEAVRTAGLAGIAALADLPETLSKRGGTPTLGGMTAEAQPHVAAVSALLREVLGADAGRATRGVLRNRRLGLNTAHERFLAAVRADRTAGPATRYNIFRQVSDMRESDPAQGTMASIYTLVQAMEAAHAGLTASSETPEAAGRVAAFEAATARLGAVTEANRRGG